jgi:hypothetical protein
VRNLPQITVVADEKFDREDCIDLKSWQAEANSDDLAALFNGEVTNVTHYQFHDLFFTIHYTQYSARYFRREVLMNVRELIAGTKTIEDIREQAALADAEESAAKANVMAIIQELRAARGK